MEISLQHGRKRMRTMTMFRKGYGGELKQASLKMNPSIQLPFDVMVSILTRVPAIHLRRLRRVCKSWNSLICGRFFIREYLKIRSNKNKPDMVSLSCENEYQGPYIMKFSERDDHRFDLSRVLKGPYYSMSNSCDGLVCIFGRINVYMVNPSIQKLRLLPTGSWHTNRDGITEDIPRVGLGFDASVGEYKVVRLFCREIRRTLSDKIISTGCEVYTLGNFHPPCWRVIRDAPLEPSSDLTVFVNGAIHWTVENERDRDVRSEIALAFDVKKETFSVILHPEGSSRPICSTVVELGGHLCVSSTQRSGMRMDIWVLKEYSRRKWVKQHSIDLTDMFRSLAFSTRPMTISEGEIVFCNDEGRKDYYDPWCEVFVDHENPSADVEHVAVYTESIVWPTARVSV